jgi:tetratricopeptide (TPR) repeat protein
MTHPRTRLLVLVAAPLVALAAARAVAEPDPKDPAALMSTGLSAYKAGEYDAAIAAFRAAYAIDERPAALFAMAQAERKRGDCATAVADYERFLATSPAERQAEAAREQRDVCKDQLAAQQPPPSGDTTAHVPAPAAAADALPHDANPTPAASLAAPADAGAGAPWYRDPVADGLAGGAVLGLALGVGFAVASSNAAADSNAANNYMTHAQLADDAARDRNLSIVGFTGAAALGGFAAWRIIRDRRTPDHVAIAPIVPSGGGLGVGIGGDF